MATPETKCRLPIASALIMGICLIAASGLFTYGLLHFRTGDRAVTVKGLATQEVEADLVLWPIRHAATGNSLAEVQGTITTNAAKIEAFLEAQGLTEGDIINRKIEMTDLMAQNYRPDNAANSRYIVTQTMMVRTDKVSVAEAASQKIGDLLAQNVSLVNDNNSSSPSFVYTRLNDIKPGMIALATANARESAQQFALDSGTSVGSIKEAWQGVFEILGRDSENSYEERRERFKTVRVVSTLKFELD
jgi:hypothetical protein